MPPRRLSCFVRGSCRGRRPRDLQLSLPFLLLLQHNSGSLGHRSFSSHKAFWLYFVFYCPAPDISSFSISIFRKTIFSVGARGYGSGCGTKGMVKGKGTLYFYQNYSLHAPLISELGVSFDLGLPILFWGKEGKGFSSNDLLFTPHTTYRIVSYLV